MIGEGEAADRATARSSRAPRRSWRGPGSRRSSSRPRRASRSSTARRYMASLGTLALLDAERLCRVADVAGAMSLEALKGSSRPFDERLQAARPHPGQAPSPRTSARSSPRARSWRATATAARCRTRTVSAACRRCTARRATRSGGCASVLEREVNTVTDNPSVFLRRRRRPTSADTSTSAAATSTGSRSRSRSTWRPWRSPSWRTSASGASSSSSTRRCRRG